MPARNRDPDVPSKTPSEAADAHRIHTPCDMADHWRHRGAQRHYYNSAPGNCAKASTIVVTILAGPLNYLGVNPKVTCPKPSK